MQVQGSKLSRAKIQHYPIIRISRDDLKEIYSLFKKYYANVTATIVYKGGSYQVKDEIDLDYPGRGLDYFEIVGYDPFANLVLCPSNPHLFVSDINDKNSMALLQDIDKLLSKRVSKLNMIVRDSMIYLLVCLSAVFGILWLFDHHSLTYAALFLISAFLLVIAYFFREYLYTLKHTLVLQKTTETNRILDNVSYIFPSRSWEDRISVMLSFGVHLSPYIIFLIIGCILFYIGYSTCKLL
jgi:hypothetical protein